MRRFPAGLAALVLAVAACNSEDSVTGPAADRIWSSNYLPTLFAGTKSIEIGVILERSATISYTIYDRIQSDMTGERVRSEAAGLGTRSPLKTGTFSVSGSKIGDTARVEMTGFPASTNLFIYMVGDPSSADPVPVDLDKVVAMSITTSQRQPGTSYASSVLSTTVGYYTYRPEGHYLHPDEKFPLLIFLHGTGEKGNGTTELNRVLVHGPPKLINQGTDLPFIVVSPQLPASQGGWSVNHIDELIARAKAESRVDTTRIYVTGLSLGGFGTWAYAVARPAVVAAVVAIAGAGNPGQACQMRDVPVWAFHGDADGTVNVSGSINMINALNACTPAPAVTPKLTIYPGVGHDSWTRTYDGSAGHDIYSWLLSYHR